MLWLSRKILEEHPNGFVSALVSGRRGIGKSAYALKVAKEAYQEHLDLNEEQAWQKALDSLIFKMENIIEELNKYATSDNMALVRVLDDLSCHAGSLRYFDKRQETSFLKSTLDTVRSGWTAMIGTCPNPDTLLKPFRDYSDLRVQIRKRNSKWQRLANGYRKYHLPSGTSRIKRKYQDQFSCYIPKKFYNQYMEIRESFLADATKELGERLDQDLSKKELLRA